MITDGFIRGTDLNPVGIFKEYLQRLRLTPGGAPIMLFPQLACRVVNPGQAKVLVVKGDGSVAIKYDYCRQQLKLILSKPIFSDKHGLDGKYGWHSFRGGSLTAQVGQGVPLHLVQQQARHASATTTLGYVNAIESEKAKASAALLADMDPHPLTPHRPPQGVGEVEEHGDLSGSDKDSAHDTVDDDAVC